MTLTAPTTQPRIADGTFTTKGQSAPELTLAATAATDLKTASSNLTDSITLATLASHIDSKVRAGVARNLGTEPRILRLLSADDDFTVRRAVAQNPRTTPHDVGKLASDDNLLVHRDALRNPNLPPAIQQQIMKSGTIEDKRSLAGNTGACGMFLEQLSNSRDRGITIAIRQNSGASKRAKENASIY